MTLFYRKEVLNGRIFQTRIKTKIKEMINTKIKVEDETYDFGDMIDNEYVSDFPIYSHRMRSTFVKGAQLIDEFLTETDSNLVKMEAAFKKNFTDFQKLKEQEIKVYIEGRKTDLNSWFETKKREYNFWYGERVRSMDGKLATVDTKIQTLDNKIGRFVELERGFHATDSKAGIITLNKVKEIVRTATPTASGNTKGLINEDRVIELARSAVTIPSVEKATHTDIDNILKRR